MPTKGANYAFIEDVEKTEMGKGLQHSEVTYEMCVEAGHDDSDH